MSQLELALEADISTRHLSFLETGRAQPSREMVLRLAAELETPLREQNLLLMAAGFAPLHPERPLEDPALAPARAAIDLILKGHEPYPALAVDRRWRLIAANASVGLLLEGVSPVLLDGAPNILRLALHPDGLAPRILNLGEWRAHLLERLAQQARAACDPELDALHEELSGYPAPAASDQRFADLGGVAVPLRLAHGEGVLSLISTTTVFGAARDVTLDEITLEAFYPADAASGALLSAAR
jgi:transcriptional regulator with XRE-family HTH domain